MNRREIVQKLLKHRLVSDQVDKVELELVLHELAHLLEQDLPGAVVEFGCYSGTTSLFIRRLLDAYDSSAELHVYDSFAGLPVKTREDQSPAGSAFIAGELRVGKQELLHNFRAQNLDPPIVHKGWFSDIEPTDIPKEILFAFLDGDFYRSIADSLWQIEDKLTPGAVIIVDDYTNPKLPGASKAVDEWLSTHPTWMLRVQASCAVLKAS